MLNRLKILIVDGSPTVRALLGTKLKRVLDYPTIIYADAAESGMKAFNDALPSTPFHLVITSFEFDRFDGALLASIIKNACSDCRIILHSGRQSDFVAVNGDFDRHVAKGDSSYTIIDALYELFDHEAQAASV